mmetsp:Transcript_35685/g.57764  ORF Transcript_35685/g.57764 Transcript_35685/m.57764 type:complete len:125 (-) Transcript_35685:132-506(-)
MVVRTEEIKYSSSSNWASRGKYFGTCCQNRSSTTECAMDSACGFGCEPSSGDHVSLRCQEGRIICVAGLKPRHVEDQTSNSGVKEGQQFRSSQEKGGYGWSLVLRLSLTPNKPGRPLQCNPNQC